MKNNAGIVINKLSFRRIRTIIPKNINSDKPPEENINNGLNHKPNNKPSAPQISRIITSSPSFSKLKRLNSLFIFGATK